MAMLRSRGSSPVMSRPPKRMRPEVGVSSPAMILRAVDLPQPEGPTSEMNSPSATSRLISCSAWTAPVGPRNSLCRRSMRTFAIGSALHAAGAHAGHQVPLDEAEGERHRQGGERRWRPDEAPGGGGGGGGGASGAGASGAAAMMRPQLVSVVETKRIMPGGSVRRLSSEIRTRAKRYSFQAKRNAKMPVAMMPGTACGSTTSQRAPRRVAPSISAASSRSMGTEAKKSRITHMTKGSEKVR